MIYLETFQSQVQPTQFMQTQLETQVEGWGKPPFAQSQVVPPQSQVVQPTPPIQVVSQPQPQSYMGQPQISHIQLIQHSLLN